MILFEKHDDDKRRRQTTTINDDDDDDDKRRRRRRRRRARERERERRVKTTTHRYSMTAETSRATGGAVDAEAERRARRENRHKLRGLIDRTRLDAEELQRPESDALERAVDMADEMRAATKEMAKTREMVLDAQLYGQLASYSLERTRRLGPRGSAEVSVSAFLQCLARTYVMRGVEDPVKEAGEDSRAMKWSKLGTVTAKYFREAPVPGFMNGVMDTEVKERRSTQRRTKEVLGPTIAPDMVEDTSAERQTDKMMSAMNKKLKKMPGGATNAIHAVNNPESFPQFVENVFTAAFLVKDGHAGITPAADGGAPTISHTVPPPAGESDRSSFVLHMDMRNWRAMNALMNNAPGMCPTREDVDDDTLYGNRGVRPTMTAKPEGAERKRRANGETSTGLADATNKKPRESFSVSH
jgi:hypothetical protein